MEIVTKKLPAKMVSACLLTLVRWTPLCHFSSLGFASLHFSSTSPKNNLIPHLGSSVSTHLKNVCVPIFGLIFQGKSE